MIEKISYLGIIGAFFVAFGYSTPANIVWAVSNPVLMFYNYRNKEFAQARMFGVFWCIAMIGLLRVSIYG